MTADTSPASSLPLDRYSFPAFLIHSAVSPLPSTSPRILGHPQCYVRETRTPYYEKRCSRSEPRHFPDCLAAFTRRLLTAGSYSRVAYYAFVGGRFSSILSFSRFTTPASASPLSLSLLFFPPSTIGCTNAGKRSTDFAVYAAPNRGTETESHASRERT